MNYEAALLSGLNTIASARDFQAIFPNAEHSIVKAKRDIDPEGWRIVYEWISRCQLHGRYMMWLAVAIDIAADSSISQLDQPQIDVVEIESIVSTNEQQRPSWEFRWAELEHQDWEQLVAHGGDFAAIEFELTTDAPVPQFEACWDISRPKHLAEPPDGLAFKAPLRFMMP